MDGHDVHCEVWVVSVDLLSLVNGVGKLHSSSFEDVRVVHVREVGEDGTSRHHTVVSADAVRLRTRADAVIIRTVESEYKEPEARDLAEIHRMVESVRIERG